jgi:UDP-2,4-diacetamido-2,4,6-trideoxy-beta-L-altropyranose hydrolase
MKVIIRVDASKSIGVGHVMRCLTLADEIKYTHNAEVTFIARDHSAQIVSSLITQRHKFITLTKANNPNKPLDGDSRYLKWLNVSWEQDADETIKVIKAIKGSIVDWLIVDHYALDYRWHKLLRPYCRKIMVIDDLADRQYDCDLLLDQTYGRIENSYFQLAPKYCQFLLGAKFALLRRGLSRLRHKAIKKRKQIKAIERILISMGSMDLDNITSIVLKGLANVEWLHIPVVDVVLSSQAPYLDSVICESRKHPLIVNVHSDVSNLEELMLESDLAIGAGGTTSWERCCLGLPSILLQLADNQKYVIAGLVQAGAVRSISEIDLHNKIVDECNDLQADLQSLKDLSKQAFTIVDGYGAKILAIQMKPQIAKDGKEVIIRCADISDTEIMYKWQSYPQTRKYFKNPETPNYSEHKKWLKAKLEDPEVYLYIIVHGDKPAGVVRLESGVNQITENAHYMVSIYIAPDHYGQGVGTLALEYIDDFFENSELHAEIHKDNVASKALFMKCGYISNDEKCLYIRPPR